MLRTLTVVVTALLVVGAARASPYWIDYEPASGQFPEQQGWQRITSHGGDQRSFDDGWLVMDGMTSPNITDYYERYISGAMDPAPGEEFVVQWRIRIDELQWYHDPGVTVYSGGKWAVGFVMSLGAIESLYEPGVSASFEPGVDHLFELRSADMRNYALSIDGAPTIQGSFWLSLTDSRVHWGDLVNGGASMASWAFFQFGVVPECDSFLLASAAGALLALLQRRTWR
jgi:hypothetical protein